MTKVEKNVFLADFQQFLMIFATFSTFDILITSYQKVVENRATTHFAQNFELYQMDTSKTMSEKSFQKSKIVSHEFSKNLPMKSSFKFSNILQSIENFESYRNHYLHLILQLVFIEKI